ncbi:MAG: isoprenylcysteine carboxylmethyltransferase family protein, partial [Acidobacteria bacterium]|nr:isoprenylcysteine carboxylmethyltransferase family protein [Acidobacteriota bacterium]
FGVVMLCWFAFVGVFLWRQTPQNPPDKKRDPGSLVGVVLQAMSYGIVWAVHRDPFTPFSSNRPVAIATSTMAMGIAIASTWLATKAVRTLGKEWSITARLIEGHKLATGGPYAYVRHPIYTGMLGMLVANGLAFSYWLPLLAALLVFFIGTIIRVSSEDRLLREAFGEQFETYARRVPAFLPGLY